PGQTPLSRYPHGTRASYTHPSTAHKPSKTRLSQQSSNGLRKRGSSPFSPAEMAPLISANTCVAYTLLKPRSIGQQHLQIARLPIRFGGTPYGVTRITALCGCERMDGWMGGRMDVGIDGPPSHV